MHRGLKKHAPLCLAAAAWLAGCGARGDLDSSLEQPSPVKVQAVALGAQHTCALLDDGTVACWGDYDSGPSQSRPVEVTTPWDATLLACGGGGSCAVLHDGTLVCWGTVTGFVDGSPPAVVGSGYTAVSLGDLYLCAVRVGGAVMCFGQDRGGQLGNASVMSTLQLAPGVPVDGLHDAVAVSAGSYFTCALRAGGSVVCWGEGPLGDGTADSSPTPVEVRGLPGPAKQIAVGSMHACALLADGTVACWGRRQGALGLDPATFTDATGLVAAPVAGLPEATMISAGDRQSCAVLDDETVRCWGTSLLPDHGSSTPELVPGLASAVAVASGTFHDCALLASGGVACWGGNDRGQLGDGTMTASDVPVSVVEMP